MGCGLTRAFCSMGDFDFASAINHHFLAPSLLLYFFAWYGVEVLELFRTWTPPKWWRPLGNLMIIALFVLWSGRMVIFFSSDEGYLSLLHKNLPMRIVHGDWSNTWEPWVE